MKLTEARILFVDDEPGLRDIFAKWLEIAHCARIVTAANGEEALDLLATEPFDLLVSDIRMPRIDGITLVRRRWEAGGQMPCVIFISGFGEIVEREMYALGVEAMLHKPIHREEFLATITRSLADRSELWQVPMPTPPRQAISINTSEDSSEEHHPISYDVPRQASSEVLHQVSFEHSSAYNSDRNSEAPHPLSPHPLDHAHPNATHVPPPCSLLAPPARLSFNPDSPLIGRGGFSLLYSGPASLGKVNFDCPLGTGLPRLRGEGHLRWRSREEGVVGIEFEWLDPECRPTVVGEILSAHPNSFIPDPTFHRHSQRS